MPQSFKVKLFIAYFHQILSHWRHFIVWRRKKKPTQNKTEEEVISFKFILFLLWVALWIADGHCCYQCRANIAKNSHCHNIFIFRTANTSRIWQERLQIYMQKSLQDFSGSQFSPLDMLRSPQEEHRGKEKKTSAEFSWYERKANFLLPWWKWAIWVCLATRNKKIFYPCGNQTAAVQASLISD